MFLSALMPLVASGPVVRAPHQYDLINIKYDLTLNFEKESISGFVINEVRTTAKNANVIFDKGPMSIESVTVTPKVKGKLSVKADRIEFATTGVPSNTKLAFKIKYSATPEAGIYFVPGFRAYPGQSAVAYTQGEMEDTHYWLPTYDFPDDKATMDGTVRVPKDFNALSNGKLVSKTVKGDHAIYNWKMDKEMSTYLISIVAGDYVSVPDGSFKGKPVEIWVPRGLESWGEASFGGTDKIISLYSKLTGIDYPWQKYAQSFVPEFMFGGMENTTCTTQTITALTPPHSHTGKEDDGLNAHELAHQWFGDLITARNWDHIWVNEGWATFMPHFWVREKLGEDAYHISRYGTQQGAYFSSLQNPMVRSNYNVPMEMFDGNAYPGGATRMFMLMHQLGEDLFWSATKKYLADFGHKNTDTEIFFKSFSKSAKVDLDEFRKQWFYTKGAPRVKLEKVGGGYEVTQVNPGFNLDLEYRVLAGQESVGAGKVKVTPGKPVKIVAEPDQLVILDPGAWTMGSFDYPADLNDQQWKNVYFSSTNAAAKMRVLNRISGKKELIHSLFDEEKSQAMQQQIVELINDEKRLLELTRSSDPFLVRTAVRNLRGKKVPEVLSRVEQIMNDTTDQILRNTAYSTLLSIKDNRETAEFGLAVNTYNYSTRLEAMDWFTRNLPDYARERALANIKVKKKGPIYIKSIQVLGRVKDKPGERVVFDLLVEFAKSRSNALVSAAVSALADYGDKAAIPVLESRRNHSLHFTRGDIEGAIARLNRVK